jgi:hypothetical protein
MKNITPMGRTAEPIAAFLDEPATRPAPGCFDPRERLEFDDD